MHTFYLLYFACRRKTWFSHEFVGTTTYIQYQYMCGLIISQKENYWQYLLLATLTHRLKPVGLR